MADEKLPDWMVGAGWGPPPPPMTPEEFRRAMCERCSAARFWFSDDPLLTALYKCRECSGEVPRETGSSPDGAGAGAGAAGIKEGKKEARCPSDRS